MKIRQWRNYFRRSKAICAENSFRHSPIFMPSRAVPAEKQPRLRTEIMQNIQDSRSWRGKWELQMQQARSRMQELMLLNAERQFLILKDLEEIKVLRGLMELYGEMAEREESS
ncbi:MAG: hypothetical protein U0176_22500 [Bacteroidia bacterium]